MKDISKQTVEIDCPECKRSIAVSLKQVANEALIRCICGQGIQVKDNNDSAKKSIRDVNKSFKELNNLFKNLGR